MPHDGSACPLCPRQGRPAPHLPESPGRWRAPRVVCSAHATDAVLPNGRRLIDVLRGARTLDSPGLPYLLNPVHVDGFTAWANFASGGWRLLAESASDAFEAQVRHEPYWLDALWRLVTHEVTFEAGSAVEVVRSFVAAEGYDALERVIALAHHARRYERYREALQRLGKPCVDSVDEANALSDAVETRLANDPAESPDELLARIRTLVRLATSRFYGIAEMWALDFECDLPMEALRARLAQHTGWEWAFRDSDRLGEYTSAYHAGMAFKVYDEHGSGNGPTYTFAMARTPYCTRDRAAVDAVARALVSAVLGRDPRPGSIDDWR